MRLAAAIVASALLLTGCSAPATSPTSSPPSPSAATAQQFASVIAGQESDWREVIDNAFNCRYLWVTGGKSAADKANAIACYAREATIVKSSGTAATKIRELTAPSDLQQLVSDTLGALDAIAGVDLEGACGEPFADGSPNDSKKCSLTQGELSQSYRKLKTVLDEWKPYT